MFIPKLVLLHRDLIASFDEDFRADCRRKKEIQPKLGSRKTYTAEGGANWKIYHFLTNLATTLSRFG